MAAVGGGSATAAVRVFVVRVFVKEMVEQITCKSVATHCQWHAVADGAQPLA